MESPSKATKIQEYLGKDYVVMSCKGSITELAKGGHFGIGVDVENNFKPHYVISPDKVVVLDQLMKAAKTCDQILLSTDPDREGEGIAWHLAQRLQDLGKPMKRMVVNEIKKSALQKSVKDLRDIDMNLFHAQEGRRILDRLVGFQASPFLMSIYGSKPSQSAGRVQSVLTRMICDREVEITTFVPETFWTIQVNLSDGKDSFFTKYSGRPTDLKVATDMKNRLSVPNAQYIVSEVNASPESKSPPPPMITSSLQRIMSKEHGFAADRTMKAAQTLYEAGYCTYIRTDSVRIGDEAVVEARQWLIDNKFPIPKKPNTFKNKDAAQDAHECIRPSDLSLLPDNNFAIIDPDEKQVYQVIWKHFVASQANPAVYNTLKIMAHVKDDKAAEVKASGKALKSPGYLQVLGIVDSSQIEIPNLTVGQVLSLYGKSPVKMEKKETQPPPRYSEDKIIKELVNKGIGRPATYSDLLSKITTRNYVEKRGVVFHATDLGKKITKELCQFFTFMDFNYTAKLEKQLDDIAAGKLEHLDMLKKFYPAFQQELNKAYLQHGGCLCDKCGAPMAKRTSKTGSQFLGCTAYPNCKGTKNLPQAA